MTSFDDLLVEMHPYFANMDFENKPFFEIYKVYREILIDLLLKQQVSPQRIQDGTKQFNHIFDIKLLDQAYLDNLFLCLYLKHQNAESYEELLPTIDKYIIPDRKTKGIEYFRANIGGLYVHMMLRQYEGLSERQLANFLSYLMPVSESKIRSHYRELKDNIDKTLDSLDPLVFDFFILLVIAFSKSETPKPIVIGNKRSESEFEMTARKHEEWLLSIQSRSQSVIDDFKEHRNLFDIETLEFEDESNIMKLLFMVGLACGLKLCPDFILLTAQNILTGEN